MFVHVVELADAMRKAVEESKICKIFGLGKSWELNGTKEDIFRSFKKLLMHSFSLDVVVKQSLISPFLRIVSKFGDDGAGKSHHPDVPVVDNASDVDVALDNFWVVGDEVGRENAAHGVCTKNDFAYF
jgi:hypothetical protein